MTFCSENPIFCDFVSLFPHLHFFAALTGLLMFIFYLKIIGRI